MRSRSTLETKDPSSLQWTASRCLRLLRPISSRVEPLRRLTRDDQLRAPQPRSDAVTKAFSSAHLSLLENALSPRSVHDPIWLPRGPAKSGSRTYSSKYRAKRGKSVPAKTDTSSHPVANGVELPTPFRTTGEGSWAHNGEEPTSPLQHRDGFQLSSPTTPAPTTRVSVGGLGRQKVGRSTPSGQKRADLESGVVRGLTALMERTAGSENRERKITGAPGLAGMCLRAVPHAIEVEAEFRRELDADDDGDAAAEIYSELEGWGPHVSAGYAGLRLVVRAHGVGLVLELFKTGALSDEAMTSIVNVLKKFGTAGEVMLLRKALLYAGRVWNGPRSGMEHRWSADQLSLRLQGQRAIQSLPPILVGQAMRDGVLKPECFVEEHFQTWIEAQSKAVARSVEGQQLTGLTIILEAACLGVTACLEKSINSKQSHHSSPGPTTILRARHSLEKVVDMLGAMALVACRTNSEAWKARIGQQVRSMFATTTLAILQRSSAKHSSPNSIDHFDKHRPFLVTKILTTALVLQMLGADSEKQHATLPYEKVIRALSYWSPANRRLLQGGCKTALTADTLANMSWICGFQEHTRSEALVRETTNHLLVVAKGLGHHDSNFLRQTALQTARMYALRHSTKSARLIARDVEAAVEDCDIEMLLPDMDAPDVTQDDLDGLSFTWDDGLQEWHAAAPIRAAITKPEVRTKLEKSRKQLWWIDKQHDSTSDSGYVSSNDEPHTPRRASRTTRVASPDELGSSTMSTLSHSSEEVDDGLRVFDEVQDSTCSLESSEPHAELAIRSQAERIGSCVAEADCEPDVSESEDNWDELAMSGEKRRAPPMPAKPSTGRDVKRQRRLHQATESDDELA